MDERLRFGVLDSLRGFAALMMAWYHYKPVTAGYLAVDFFFVLSGFVLSHRYVYSTPVEAKTFIICRLARLYPLHVFTLAMFAITFALIHGNFPSYTDGILFTLFQHLTLTHNIGFNPSGITWNYPSWSISVEFWVNVLFIVVISKRIKSTILFLISIFLFLFVYLHTSHLGTFYQNYYGLINSGLLRGVASFIVGIFAYRLYLFFQEYQASRNFYSVAELLSIFLFFVIFFGRDGKYSKLDFLAPFIFLLMVVAFSFERGYVSSLIKPFQFLATISYSIYLNHVIVLLVMNHLLSKETM